MGSSLKKNVSRITTSMIHTETEFAYRHRPTGKWCYIYSYYDELRWDPNVRVLDLIDEFDPDILYRAKNIIEEDLLHSTMNDTKYAAQNFLEFELVEFEIEYKLK